MKICILGAGSLGSTIGGALAETGMDVYLINRRPEFVQKINEEGLKIRVDDKEKIVPIKARTTSKGIGPVDLIIVLVKAFHTREAMEAATDLLGEHTMVMSLQNGLGNEEVLSEVVGQERIIGGKTYVGGVMLEPGHILAGIEGKHTYIGELDGTVTERITNISKVFTKAGLATVVSHNILGIIWDKLLINAATGALSGITKLPYGGLYDIPEIEAVALQAVEEGIAVAKANEVVLSMEDPKQIWLKAAEGLPKDFKTSILQSFEKGSITEIDYINGSIVRWGKRCHIATPINETLVANIKGIEYWMEHYADTRKT